MSATKRIAVRISAATYTKLESYARIMSKPSSHVVDEALADWLDTVAEANLERVAGVPLPDFTLLASDLEHAIQPLEEAVARAEDRSRSHMS